MLHTSTFSLWLWIKKSKNHQIHHHFLKSFL